MTLEVNKKAPKYFVHKSLNLDNSLEKKKSKNAFNFKFHPGRAFL